MTVTEPLSTGHALGSLFRLPGYGTVAIGSLAWHVNRWGALFATTLLLTRTGASPLHIQLMGALFFAPMLIGAFAASTSNALATPRAVVLSLQAVHIPVHLLMFAVVSLGVLQTWMTALFVLLVGLGNTVNMTAQRMLILDKVGERLAPTALAVEPLLSGAGSMSGSFGAGLLVDWFGTAASFGALALLAVISFCITLRVPPTPRRLPPGEGAAPRTGLGMLLRKYPGVAALLAVTIVMNLFVLGYATLVPKIAETFTQSAATAGLLASTTGLGQLTGGVAVAARAVRRRGLLLVAGSALCVAGVAVFAVSSQPAVAFCSLFVAGIGQAGFGAMQSVIAVEPSDPAERAAALGTVSMAVGANPLGLVLMGAFSEGLGARGGVLLATLTGFIMLGVVATIWRPVWLPSHQSREVHHM